MQVNFLDLKAQYKTIKNEVNEAIQKVLDSCAFAAGPFVKEFEDNFAQAHQTKYCVGVNNGTSALHIALWSLGVGPGDEVIVPINTFIATAEGVSLAGATPVFVDNDKDYYNIDMNLIEEKITSKTKAIIPVHLYGQPVNMDEIKKIATKHNLLIIEDCAQAHLATWQNKPVGGFGVCGCFSFYPGKNLGAYGEAGAVVTNDDQLAEKMFMLRDHGSKVKYHHEVVGHNYRMEGIQGAVLNVKLKHLNEWTESRQSKAEFYDQLLADVDEVVTPTVLHGAKHVYHLYVIRCQKRDALQNFLKEKGIFTALHYPIPLHLQKAYKHLGYQKGDFPVAEKYANEILSLPMFPELKEEEIKYIVASIKEFYSKQ